MTAFFNDRIDNGRENALKLSVLNAHRDVVWQLAEGCNLPAEMLYSAFVMLDKKKDELDASQILEALMRKKCLKHD